MDSFIVSARKYRPQNFKEVVGQQAITNTLENAIKNNHLAQALLFTGPRGVGKTSCARILAKRINQEVQVSEDEDFAFNIFELDAASNNSVDDIRSLTEQVRIPPQIGKYKVYIIDEVHMLSKSAFNAFLKTLEEPPSHTIFILATTEKHKIIPTILSRCQIFDFKRISVTDIKNSLREICKKQDITARDNALHIIAQKADGAMRDALSIFDRVVSFCGNDLTGEAVMQNLNVLDYEVYFEITDLLLNNNIPKVLVAFDDILGKGFEGHHFMSGLASHFRDLLVARDKITTDLLQVSDSMKKRYFEQATQVSLTFLISAIEKANQCDIHYKMSKNQRLLVELTLMQMASINFNKEKNEINKYIIPATSFSKNPLVTKKTSQETAEETTIQQKITENTQKSTSTEITKKEEIRNKITQIPEKPILKNTNRRISPLSLKSVQLKKTEKETAVTQENYENHPRTPFTQKDLIKVWDNYRQKLIVSGLKNTASIMASNKPKLSGEFVIKMEVPNNQMGDQLKTDKPKLLKFLRDSLDNYAIELQVQVNQAIEKRMIYSKTDKYQKLIENNSSLGELREKFQLDLDS